MKIRCAGIVISNHKVLLVRSQYHNKEYWILPGGGLEVGETHFDCVKREVKEETNIDVEVGKLIFTDKNEMEHLTYLCTPISDDVKTGSDPDQEHTVIIETKYISAKELELIENFIPEKMKFHLLKGLKEGFHEVTDLRD